MTVSELKGIAQVLFDTLSSEGEQPPYDGRVSGPGWMARREIEVDGRMVDLEVNASGGSRGRVFLTSSRWEEYRAVVVSIQGGDVGGAVEEAWAKYVGMDRWWAGRR